MILEGGALQLVKPRSGRKALHEDSGFRSSDHVRELARVEHEIEVATQKAKRLADELGARYAVLRCQVRKYDDGADIRGAYIMKLSRQTDECIESIYVLEQRRRELLRTVGR